MGGVEDGKEKCGGEGAGAGLDDGGEGGFGGEHPERDVVVDLGVVFRGEPVR